MKRNALITVFVVVVCFFAGVFFAEYIRSNQQIEIPAPAPITATQDLIGTPSPEFSLMDVSGQLRNVSEWRGKVLVINFWASWCPPCVEEIPHFVQLQEKYGQAGLQFIGIGLESVDEVSGFSEVLGINYPLLLGQQEVIELANKFGNRTGGLPYTVILDRSGDINFIKQGPLSISEAEQVMTSLL